MRVIVTLVAVSSALSGCVTKEPSETCDYPDNTFIVAAPEDVRVWVWAPNEWLKETPILRMDIESPQGTTETFWPRLTRIEDMPAPPSNKCSDAGQLLMFEDPPSASGMLKLFEPTDTVRKFYFAMGLPSVPPGTTRVRMNKFGLALMNKVGKTMVVCGCASPRV
jgi:hypothetical protein